MLLEHKTTTNKLYMYIYTKMQIWLVFFKKGSSHLQSARPPHRTLPRFYVQMKEGDLGHSCLHYTLLATRTRGFSWMAPGFCLFQALTNERHSQLAPPPSHLRVAWFSLWIVRYVAGAHHQHGHLVENGTTTANGEFRLLHQLGRPFSKVTPADCHVT